MQRELCPDICPWQNSFLLYISRKPTRTPIRASQKNILPLSAVFGRTTEIFFRICAIFNRTKVTGGHNFIIFAR